MISTDPAETGVDQVQSLALLAQQTTILEMLSAGEPLAEVLTAVTLALESHMPGAWCSVLLHDAANARLTNGAATSLPAAYNDAIEGIAVGTNAGSCGTAAFLDQTVVAHDITVDPRWVDFRAVATEHGLRACWSSPIHGRDGAVVGTFAVYHAHPHTPTAREERLVERYRHLAAVAISHTALWGALAESEEQFRRAFEDNAVGMALLDLHGRFLRVNSAMCELTGRPESDLVGRHFRVITEDEDVGTAARAFAGLAGGASASIHLETRYRRPDGTLRWVDVTASIVRGHDGSRRHISANVLDLSARKAAERERLARRDADLARAAAEEASRAKSDFLTTMSHEVRTPLSAIVGFTELLETLELSAERRTTAHGHIVRAARHILAILDDVLDLAKIEAGALPMEFSPVPVVVAVHQTLELLAPLAADQGLTVTPRDMDDTLSVRADARRLRQVLLNVVSNAIKYNRPGGRVDLSVRCGAQPGQVAVTVTDTGTGIAEHLLPRLFTPFDRLGAPQRDPAGAGLGLVVTERLVTAMGGTLSVHSSAGVGTSVEITLPTLTTV